MGLEYWYNYPAMTSRNSRTDIPRDRPDPAGDGVWAVVPMKVLGEAKKRLHPCLGEKREAFTLAMLEDVLSALDDSRLIGRIACVTADSRIAAAAARHGALVVDEGRPRGMNEAIRLGIEAARARGARRVVVLPADLPLASGGEIDRLVSALQDQSSPGRPPVLGLSPAGDGLGTNFLSLEVAQPFETSFGRDSFRRHQANARAAGFTVIVLPSDSLSLDIDNGQNLQDLISYCLRHTEFQAGSTWKFLCSNGLVDAPEHSN